MAAAPRSKRCRRSPISPSTYYQRWFLGLERRVVSHGLVGARRARRRATSLRPGGRAQPHADGRGLAARDESRGNFERPAPAPARFKEGDRVRTRNINPATHTRLPRYARGKLGTVEAIRGCHVYPDTAAIGAGDDPQWLYTVVFTGRELWGDEADPNVKVSIEAFEPYLEPA